MADGGGGDGPEDVMGGLRVALLRLSWRPDACKVFGIRTCFVSLSNLVHGELMIVHVKLPKKG